MKMPPSSQNGNKNAEIFIMILLDPQHSDAGQRAGMANRKDLLPYSKISRFSKNPFIYIPESLCGKFLNSILEADA